ncbi:MAG: hypothetical protein LBK01_06785 [Burkholderiaceae bacterium]|jgi:hypothetical protein|nr:hypothetical protein [Burkholderiaceae bacterium]
MMISSAKEFIHLRDSTVKEEYDRSAYEEAPLKVWKEVLEKYSDYARWVVHNKTVPLEILEILSFSEDVDIRWEVATKRKLSPELFERLSKDRETTVRVRIAVNRKTPLSILDVLCNDEDADVASGAQMNKEDRVARIG